MGKKTSLRSLNLWMNGVQVGIWKMGGNGADLLQYTDEWIASSQGRPLSLSLPFTPGNQPHRGGAVRTYFENLLPDSKGIRERVARRFQLGSTDAFALLAEIGRDCVGALQIMPGTMEPDDIHTVSGSPLTEAEVAQVLRNVVTPAPFSDHTPADDEGFRISIAGAQEKTALLWNENRWCLPQGATPTTHIFKMPLGLVGNWQVDMRDSVENEWLCSEILRAYDIPVARTQILQFEDMKVLSVERFDRRRVTRSPWPRPWFLRLPQEDMCQATGTPPHLKYESDSGPGMREILRLLGMSIDPDRDRRIFFQAQVLYWMLCASDGHAKNFSIFLRPGGSFELTPLYDVLSAYPVMGKGAKQLSPMKVKMAMAVRSKNAHWKMHEIQRRHWVTVGAEHGVVTSDGRGVEHVIDDLVARTPQVIDTVRDSLPSGFPPKVADSILDGLRRAADTLGQSGSRRSTADALPA